MDDIPSGRGVGICWDSREWALTISRVKELAVCAHCTAVHASRAIISCVCKPAFQRTVLVDRNGQTSTTSAVGQPKDRVWRRSGNDNVIGVCAARRERDIGLVGEAQIGVNAVALKVARGSDIEILFVCLAVKESANGSDSSIAQPATEDVHQEQSISGRWCSGP